MKTHSLSLALLIAVASAPTFAADEKTLKEVTVTSAGVNDIDERKQSATQKIIVTREEIEKMGALTINDVLGKLPGVDVGTPTSDGTMSTRSRGMMRDSVQIVVDGERIPPGHNRMIQGTVGRLPSGELRQIEIVRGSSAEFGGSAPVTVHLILDKPMSRESTDVKIAAGARGNQPTLQANYTKNGGDKRFAWSLPITINHNESPSDRQIGRTDSTGIRQNDHTQSNHASDSFSIAPRWTWKSGGDNLTLNPLVFRSQGKGKSDFERVDLGIPGNSYTRKDEDLLQRSYDRLRATGEIVRQGVKYTSRLMAANSEQKSRAKRVNQTTLAVSEDETQREAFDTNAAFRLDWSAGSHVLAANLEHTGHKSDERLVSTGYATETHESWDRQWTAWLQDEWALNKTTTLTGGLRGEFFQYAVDGARQKHQRWLPSVAIRWEPVQQWVLRSSLGAGIKPPRLDELTNQPVRSVNANTPLEPDQRGNPNLRPERSVNFEAVIERYLPNDAGVFGINAFVRRTEDFTERRVQLEGGRYVDRPYNEGTARHWGVELDGKLRTDTLGWRGATLRAHLTLPRSQVQDERLGLRRPARETPRYILSAGFDQTMATMSFGASMSHSGRVRTDTSGEQAFETKAKTVVNAYALQKLDATWNLRLSGDNLFRAKTSRQQDAFAPGSSWSLTSTDQGVRTMLLSLEGKW
ncbi:MAG: TonB-dependent receptor [Rhodocyclaceae bacterium]|nr:TonB-dependent receptor [Rhodocyclaceae bacterium]